jgi:hypothetical protein
MVGFDRNLNKALAAWRRPGARLIVRYIKRPPGRVFSIAPGGGAGSARVGRMLLERYAIRPANEGLFFGRPQSWCLRSDRRGAA